VRPGVKQVATLVVAIGTACAAIAATSGSAAVPVQTPAAALVLAMNDARAQEGLPPLRISKLLERAALAHDREMLRFGFFGHSSPDGREFWQRLERWYPPQGQGWTVGENLLAGSPNVSMKQTVAAWLASPEHRTILLSNAWLAVGVAVLHSSHAPGVYEGEATTFVTADFGRPG
jgi:uncharacterized protein YkwD